VVALVPLVEVPVAGRGESKEEAGREEYHESTGLALYAVEAPRHDQERSARYGHRELEPSASRRPRRDVRHPGHREAIALRARVVKRRPGPNARSASCGGVLRRPLVLCAMSPSRRETVISDH